MLRIDPAEPSEHQAQPQVGVLSLGSSLCHRRRWSTVKAHGLRSSTALSHIVPMAYLDFGTLLRKLGPMVPSWQQAGIDQISDLLGACSAGAREV